MNNTWSNAFNWSGVAPVPEDDLEFPFDASKVNNSDNYPNGTTFNSILFWHGGSGGNGSFDLAGNSIALNAGVSVTNNSLTGWGDSVNNALLLNSNQTFGTGPFTSLAFFGAINLNGKTLTFDTASASPIDVHAVLSSSGSLVKTGPGTLTLYSNNTYTGSTTLIDGMFVLSGSAGAIPNSTNIALAGASAVLNRAGGSVLNSGQTLSGIGTVAGDLTAQPGAVISGGNNGSGILTFNNNMTAEAGSAMVAVLNGTIPGTGYNQLYVHGNVNLLNPTLNVRLGYASAAGDSFVIITNGGANAVTGTFSGLPEGTFFTNGGTGFRITYVGGDGNDVVLIRTNPPPTLIVTTTADNGGGSLRGTLAIATNGNTIVFATNVTGSIKLTTGELVVTQSVSILGPGPGILAVDGNAAGRLFHITNGVTAFISGLTITNGLLRGITVINGGGLWNDHSALTLSNCAVTSNGNTNGYGAGIYNDGSSGSATLWLVACSVSYNSTQLGSGGGIYKNGELGSANLSIVASTLDNNSAGGIGSVGGGIFNDGNNGNATLAVTNCTFYVNTAPQFGGGISTSGGGSGTGVTTVVACTFNGDETQSGFGACLSINGAGGTLQVGNTILARDGVESSINNQTGTFISLGYNLANDPSGFLTNATDQIATNPRLGPLADNGGPTMTCSPLWGSPAIDKGKTFGLATDQRGIPRPYDFSTLTNATDGDGSDIGAVEFIPPGPLISIAAPTNSIHLQGVGLSNLTYTLSGNTNLSTTNWSVIGSALANSAGSFTFTDTNAPLYPRRFYRATYP
jgi:autotransporter-associated beta strand protein